MRNLRSPCGQTPLEEDNHSHAIKKVYTSPKKMDVGVITAMHDLDSPERFWDEVLDSEIAINNEAQSGKLARPCKTISI